MGLMEDYLKYGNFLFKYRSYVPLFMILIIIVVFFFQLEDIPSLSFNEIGLWTEICFCVSMLGIFIRIIAVGYSSPNTSGRNVNSQKADSINTTGIYSIVRHPLYLGNYCIWLGIIMRIPSFTLPTIITILYWLYYEKIMFAEEGFLRDKFGIEFIQWSNRTPAVIPNFFLWKKNQNSFDWKKVIRKENDGIYAFLLSFYLIIPLDLFIDSYKFDIAQHETSIVILLVSTLLYIIVKFIKKKTKLLK